MVDDENNSNYLDQRVEQYNKILTVLEKTEATNIPLTEFVKNVNSYLKLVYEQTDVLLIDLIKVNEILEKTTHKCVVEGKLYYMQILIFHFSNFTRTPSKLLNYKYRKNMNHQIELTRYFKVIYNICECVTKVKSENINEREIVDMVHTLCYHISNSLSDLCINSLTKRTSTLPLFYYADILAQNKVLELLIYLYFSNKLCLNNEKVLQALFCFSEFKEFDKCFIQCKIGEIFLLPLITGEPIHNLIIDITTNINDRNGKCLEDALSKYEKNYDNILQNMFKHIDKYVQTESYIPTAKNFLKLATYILEFLNRHFDTVFSFLNKSSIKEISNTFTITPFKILNELITSFQNIMKKKNEEISLDKSLSTFYTFVDLFLCILRNVVELISKFFLKEDSTQLGLGLGFGFSNADLTNQVSYEKYKDDKTEKILLKSSKNLRNVVSSQNCEDGKNILHTQNFQAVQNFHYVQNIPNVDIVSGVDVVKDIQHIKNTQNLLFDKKMRKQKKEITDDMKLLIKNILHLSLDIRKNVISCSFEEKEISSALCFDIILCVNNYFKECIAEENICGEIFKELQKMRNEEIVDAIYCQHVETLFYLCFKNTTVSKHIITEMFLKSIENDFYKIVKKENTEDLKEQEINTLLRFYYFGFFYIFLKNNTNCYSFSSFIAFIIHEELKHKSFLLQNDLYALLFMKFLYLTFSNKWYDFKTFLSKQLFEDLLKIFEKCSISLKEAILKLLFQWIENDSIFAEIKKHIKRSKTIFAVLINFWDVLEKNENEVNEPLLETAGINVTTVFFLIFIYFFFLPFFLSFFFCSIYFLASLLQFFVHFFQERKFEIYQILKLLTNDFKSHISFFTKRENLLNSSKSIIIFEEKVTLDIYLSIKKKIIDKKIVVLDDSLSIIDEKIKKCYEKIEEIQQNYDETIIKTMHKKQNELEVYYSLFREQHKIK